MRASLHFLPVEQVDQVLDAALGMHLQSEADSFNAIPTQPAAGRVSITQ